MNKFQIGDSVRVKSNSLANWCRNMRGIVRDIRGDEDDFIGVDFDIPENGKDSLYGHTLNGTLPGNTGFYVESKELIKEGDNLMSMKRCSYCEEYKNDCKMVDDRYLCGECYPRRTFTCDSCGQVHDMRRRMRGSNICRICFDEKYFKCAKCEKVTLNSEGTFVDGVRICPSCVEHETSACAVCGERHFTNELHSIAHQLYCDDCYEKNYPKCPLCGKRHMASNMTQVELTDGTFMVCSACLKTLVKCDHCGKMFEKASMSKTQDGSNVCEVCLSFHYRRCACCGVYYPKDSTHFNPVFIVNTRAVVCDACLPKYEKCSHCGEYFQKKSLLEVDGEKYCQKCARTLFPPCAECGKPLTPKTIFKIGQKTYCERCYNVARAGLSGCLDAAVVRYEAPSGIDGHGAKPTPIMFPTLDFEDPVYYGIELEVDARSDSHRERNTVANEVNRLLGYTYAKTDGSLGCGIEFVTHPAKLDYHLQTKHDAWIEAMKLIRKSGFSSHSAGTCGLHVHVSSAPIEASCEDAVEKIVFMFDKFWDKLLMFSRRNSNQMNWAQPYSTNINVSYNDSQAKEACKRAKDGLKRSGRYHAVNLTNARTIEFRLMRGTLVPNTFFATLILLDRIVRIAMTQPLDTIRKMTWEELVDVDSPELKKYLEQRKLGDKACEEDNTRDM